MKVNDDEMKVITSAAELAFIYRAVFWFREECRGKSLTADVVKCDSLLTDISELVKEG